LRVILGPQEDDFSERAKQTFFGACFTVSAESDRSGIRLQGPCIGKNPATAESIISEGVICGAIQVPEDGQPIIILGETVTGGYHKIATVISADFTSLGQIKAGDEIRFKSVSLDEAHQAIRDMEYRVKSIKARLVE
jgi:allophanate hydrolase subunit 2